METAVHSQFRRSLPNESLSGTSFYTSVAANVRRLRSPGNDREPPMRYLIQNRINAYPLKFRQPRVFSAVKNSLNSTMADEAKQKNSSSVESAVKSAQEVKQKESESLTSRNIPPPPEKPLPGDCCGSGCVRCVWDVYYEELEEYNKLYKSSPDSAKPSS